MGSCPPFSHLAWLLLPMEIPIQPDSDHCGISTGPSDGENGLWGFIKSNLLLMVRAKTGTKRPANLKHRARQSKFLWTRSENLDLQGDTPKTTWSELERIYAKPQDGMIVIFGCPWGVLLPAHVC